MTNMTRKQVIELVNTNLSDEPPYRIDNVILVDKVSSPYWLVYCIYVDQNGNDVFMDPGMIVLKVIDTTGKVEIDLDF